MKFILLILVTLLFGKSTFAQGKSNTQNSFNNKGRTQQNNNTSTGKQIINNYSYYTINYNYNTNLSIKVNSINATKGFFKKIKDTTHSIPIIKLGGLTSWANTHAFTIGSNPVDPINASKINGQINIEAVLRDSKGHEFARITGNT